jgi:hypothetical protein
MTRVDDVLAATPAHHREGTMSDLIEIFGGKFNAEPRPVELLDVVCLR